MAKARFDWDPAKDRANRLKHGVDFTTAQSSALLAPDSGGKANRSMSAKIKNTDEPMGSPKVIADFLPTPEELVFREEGVKITLALSKRSVEFFKREATKHNTQYQRMIRRLLDAYAEQYGQPLTSGSPRRPPAGLRPRGGRRLP